MTDRAIGDEIGGEVEGLKVLLVDDLTTDGGSKLNFARGLRAAGAIVAHVRPGRSSQE